jgi:aldehyde:ferredoxin oxidoreductase
VGIKMTRKWFGWKGKILRIDLSKKKISYQQLPEEWCRRFIGCRGINSKLLYDEVQRNTDPFQPENKLIIGTGPLEGTPLGMGRISVTTKSPRGTIAEGGIGGDFGPELKYAGYDCVVIEGRSESPVYVWIDDSVVEIRDATFLWGKTIPETEEIIRNELADQNIKVLCIGPAGENLVHSSPIFSGDHAGGRAGCGEIMGFKRLKAVAVRGTQGVQVAGPDVFEKNCDEVRKTLDLKEAKDPWIISFSVFGSLSVVRIFNECYQLHSFNCQRLEWEKAENLVAELYLKDYVTKPEACFCCPFPSCGQFFRIKEGEFAGTKGANIRAGTCIALGSLLGIDNLPAVLKMQSLCNQLGLDYFHVGYTIAWAMECYEKGILSDKDTGGIKLNFGDYKAAIEVIKMIAYRTGFGNILAEGAQKASRIIGRGSEKYALTVKGQELETMPLRTLYTAALGVATSEVGPDHTRWYPPYIPNPALIPKGFLRKIGIDAANLETFKAASTKNEGVLLKFLSDRAAVIESLPGCIFVCVRGRLGFDFKLWGEVLTSATGVVFNEEELLKSGERIVNLERSFNVREGFRRSHDVLPGRILEENVPNSIYKAISREDFNCMLDSYYEARGWTRDGVPTEKKLKELQLEEVINDFRTLNILRG